jgi:hypothetical protein
MMCGVGWYLVTDISGKIVSTFKGQTVREEGREYKDA